MTDPRTRRLARLESDLGDAADLLSGIIQSRAARLDDWELFASDDDLLGAVEGLEDAVRAWREEE